MKIYKCSVEKVEVNAVIVAVVYHYMEDKDLKSLKKYYPLEFAEAAIKLLKKGGFVEVWVEEEV